jgi:hypothetical protein
MRSQRVVVTCWFGVFEGSGENVSVADDGSTVELTIPTDLDPDCFNGEGYLNVKTLTTVPGTATTPTYTKEIVWSGILEYPTGPQAASTTSLRFDRPVGLSVIPTKAIVTVRADVLPSVTGFLDFYVDGNHVPGGIDVPPAKSSTVVFPLPKLGRGNHTVIAVFRENQSLLGSRSPNTVLRIVI